MDAHTVRKQPAQGPGVRSQPVGVQQVPQDYIILAVYAVGLVAVALVTPLQVPELLAIAWSAHFTWSNFLSWIPQAVDPSPLGYFIQFPFVSLFGVSRLGTRVPALLFAIGSALLFLKLAKRAVGQHRRMALVLFILLPLQLLMFTSSIQFEAGAFFVLLASLAFFRLVDQPDLKRTAILTLSTAACLFTDRHAGVPVFGAVLFLSRFAAGPQQGDALWFALGSVVTAAAAYVPFYIWAATQTSSHWLSESKFPLTETPDLTVTTCLLAVAIAAIVAGVCMGASASFGHGISRLNRRVALFCLLGSALLSLGLIFGTALYNVSAITVRDLIYASPSTLILFVAGLNRAARNGGSDLRRVMRATAISVALIFTWCDLDFLFTSKQDLVTESRYVAPELTKDACVAFVSEYFSRPLFFLLQPGLQTRECYNFFYHRVVLASHPYVTPDQQRNAENYMIGMGFREVKRVRSGGGKIEVFETKEQ